LAEHGIDADFYLRRRPLDETLPWDHIDAGLSKRFLRQDLARAVNGILTPDCSIERCTYCGACDFEEVRNRDYHLAGAKGGEHRGREISRWAERAVPDDGDPLPAWETKAWREIRTRVAARRAPSTRAGATVDTPLPAPLALTGGDGPTPRGDGNAEE